MNADFWGGPAIFAQGPTSGKSIPIARPRPNSSTTAGRMRVRALNSASKCRKPIRCRCWIGEVSQNASRALEIVAQILFAEVEGVHAIIRQATEEIRLRHAGKLVDRKSTRLNSSHLVISYAVFC